ncbi:bactofilin family protein [Gloeocapsopsis crepidinum]|nr:polymer-forming cytoskeletal protein [Gloeocapsopsis crepidinum]
MRHKWRTAITGFLCTLLLLLFLVTPVWSLASRSKDQVIIGANEVIANDLYVAGRTITINGTVNGDLVAAGRLITINGTVQGDLLAAGQAVVINGAVNDDLRVVSQVTQLSSNARIGDDVVAAGWSFESVAGSTVASDLAFTGWQALLAGSVGRNVIGSMAALELRSSIGSNVNVTMGAEGDAPEAYPPFFPQPPVPTPQLRAGLTVADSVQIGSNLTYRSPDVANISQQAQIAGGVIREALPEAETVAPNPVAIIVQQLQYLLALVLVGWLLLKFVPSWIQRLAAIASSKPLPSVGWGIVSLLLVGIIAFAIAVVTFVLTALSAVTLPILIIPIMGLGTLANLALFVSFFLFATFVPQIIVSLLSGYWLMQKLQPNTSSRRFVSLIVGLFVFVILTAIPLIGGLLHLATIFLGLGALWIWIRNKRDRTPKEDQLIAV